jgi:DUF1009 family protein
MTPWVIVTEQAIMDGTQPSLSKEPIGIIAGGGKFPMLIAESARREGHPVVAVAHYDETDPALEEKVDKIIWIKLGQLGQLIKALKKNRVRKALMAGSIKKHRMFSKIRPDMAGLALMSKIAMFHDDGILKALAKEFESKGIEILSCIVFLPDLLAKKGCLTRKKPAKSEKEDIEFGWEMAKELGRLDIGQCVVVRNKTVVALEAMEGTDETILRGGKLAREKAVVVKVSKPNQDLRFDIPTVGLKTVELLSEVKASVLAVEAEKTLMFDKPEMIACADRAGISIVAL